jgi:hypothetical protein
VATPSIVIHSRRSNRYCYYSIVVERLEYALRPPGVDFGKHEGAAEKES